MDLITNIPDTGDKKRVVIIGGGFAGLDLARTLDKNLYQVVLIDKNNYYQFQPLMYQVATAGLEPSSISYPLRKGFHKAKNFHFRMCKATMVDSQNKILETSIGKISYDYLAIATGCDTNYFGNDSLKETTYALKSVSESLLLRNKILFSFEQALSAQSEDELKQLLTFVIVGGGATGVELAGALADMRRKVLPKDYPELDFSKMEIHLVDASPRLLAGMSEQASATAAKTLTKRGVIIHQDVAVNSYDKPVVKLNNGVEITTDNVMWVAGIKGNGLPGIADEAYNRGRIMVNEYNQINGYEDIFCVGDTAVMIAEATPKGHPQVAQVAMQMACRVAKNLNNKAKGKKPEKFVYSDRGSLATIGRSAAVADLGRFKFGGVVAWWLWLFIHIMTIVGMRNRASIFIDWMWSYLNYDVSLRLLIRPISDKIYEERKPL